MSLIRFHYTGLRKSQGVFHYRPGFVQPSYACKGSLIYCDDSELLASYWLVELKSRDILTVKSSVIQINGFFYPHLLLGVLLRKTI